VLLPRVLSNYYRGPSIEQQHWNWDAHVKTLLRKGQFRQFYRLSYNSFCVLHLSDQLKMNRNQNNNIAPEIIMNCTLRYHAGGSHQDIPVTTGLSVSTFYNLHPSWYWCNQQTSSTIITVSYDRRGAKKDCCRIPSKKFFRNDGWLHRFIGWMAMQVKSSHSETNLKCVIIFIGALSVSVMAWMFKRHVTLIVVSLCFHIEVPVEQAK
jgi:hypothetical protein